MSLFDCLTWIWVRGVVDLLIVRKEEKFISNLFPDDVAIEILVRLPADDVMKCRRLCRPWKTLTSTPYFIEHHLKRATPSFLLQVLRYGYIDNELFICSKDDDKKLKFSDIDASLLNKKKNFNDYQPRLLESCNGLLLFEATLKSRKFFVLNPITQEQVSVDLPPGESGNVCAIFFHPSTRDYIVLYWQQLRSYHYQYFTYSVRARTWKQISSFWTQPIKDWNSTVILNGCLHWKVGPELNPGNNKKIMIYRIDKEDFRAMPRPGHERRGSQGYRRNPEMYLFQMNDRLTFCHMRLERMAIEIWVLEDYENWGWVKQCEVRLYGEVKPDEFCLAIKNLKMIRLLGIQNDELLFDWSRNGVFCYQFKHKRFKKVETNKKPGIFLLTGQTVAYTKSLVSPIKLCESRGFMR